MTLLQLLGLSPSEEDHQLKQLVDNSYASVRVVGRGRIKIDPKEVRETQEFRQAREAAKAIVGGQSAARGLSNGHPRHSFSSMRWNVIGGPKRVSNGVGQHREC